MITTLPSLDFIKKLFKVYDLIESKKPTRKMLLEKLSASDNSEAISERTLQRYIKCLKDDFYINIVRRQENGELRYLVEETDLVPDIKLLENMLYMGYLYNKVQGRLNTANGIFTDLDLTFNKYQQTISDCLRGIQSGKVVIIEHRIFHKPKPVKHTIIPYYVLERDRHWFLVAQRFEDKKWRIFGLDRISGITLTDDKAEKEPGISPKKLFGNLIGVSGMGNETETVKLKFGPEQANYERNYPIHNSFSEEVMDSYSIVTYQLVINYEFECKLKALGSRVEILEPQHLKDRIIKDYKEALIKYTLSSPDLG